MIYFQLFTTFRYKSSKNSDYYAKEEGLAEGREEGKEEKSLEIAKKMLEANSSIDFICQMTGLSEEEVLKLKSE